MRILEIIKASTKYLENYGIEDALADAEIIILHATGIDRLTAYIENPEIEKRLYTKLRRLIKRRAMGEPVQYIIGHVNFFGLMIKIGRGVLIPRPETELLVQEAIKTIKSDLSSVRKILDLCTGSGCIALALAKEFPSTTVYGTDLSPKAIRYAKLNAAANSINNVVFLNGSMFSPVNSLEFDMIISNPPYIKTDDISMLQREIKDWEPFDALNGGIDGLDFYRQIFSSAAAHIKKEGYIILEMGYDQAEEVEGIARSNSFNDITIIRDYSGIKRILKARQ